jgi:hypothetical protein
LFWTVVACPTHLVQYLLNQVWLSELNGVLGRPSHFDSQVIINLSLISNVKALLEERGNDIINVFGARPTEDGIINIDKQHGFVFVEDTFSYFALEEIPIFKSLNKVVISDTPYLLLTI